MAPGRLAAQPPPIEPTTAGPTAAEIPLPSTLAADASPEFRAVAEALVAAMREFRIPGAALAILAGDREEHATFGVASLSSLRPVTPDTLFQIGSLTKTYTATAIWRLIDEGALALDAPVRTCLPNLRLSDETTAATVTVANLLDHTAGWYGDEGFDTGSDDDALARYVAERLPVLPQLFPCGAFFSYNNAAFQLLGRLIEVATRTPYNEAMQRLLLRPLSLKDSLLEREAVLRRAYADGHIALPINGRDAVAVQTPLWVPRSIEPAGGIWSTTRDVLRYARLHLGAHAAPERSSVVQPASLRRMQEPAVPVPGLPVWMGLDWFVQEVDGVRAIMHNGDTLGSASTRCSSRYPSTASPSSCCSTSYPAWPRSSSYWPKRWPATPGLGGCRARWGWRRPARPTGRGARHPHARAVGGVRWPLRRPRGDRHVQPHGRRPGADDRAAATRAGADHLPGAG